MTQTGSVAEGRLSDWISGKGARRKGGKVPPHVMVYFAMALALFAEEDCEETWDTEGAFLGPWRKMSMDGLRRCWRRSARACPRAAASSPWRARCTRDWSPW